MTDEFKPVLDRARAVVEARELIDLASPLLREVVNRASYAFQEVRRRPSTRAVKTRIWHRSSFIAISSSLWTA